MEDASNEMSFVAIDEIDTQILMHRNAHFAGSFLEMEVYYAQEGKGAQAEIDLQRIKELAILERKYGQNLSDLLISQGQKSEVAKSLRTYMLLRSAYETNEVIPKLVADLILSEELEPEKEIYELVKVGKRAISPLIALFESEVFRSPLFPGYGLAPELAARCLGQIGDPQAIVPLFKGIGYNDFFTEDVIVEALKSIGKESEQFLLKILQSKPFTQENEHAALALVHFREHYKVAKTALSMLNQLDWHEYLSFANYLIIIASGLIGTPLEKDFLKLAESEHIPHLLRQDLRTLQEKWEPSEKAL